MRVCLLLSCITTVQRQRMLIDNIARDLRMYAEEGRGEEIVNLLGELSDSTFDTMITTLDYRSGELPLHVAVRNGHGLGVLDHISTTRNGEELIHVRTKGGYSALHLAALHGNIKAVEWLLSKHPADCNLPDQVNYNTPLHLAVDHGHKDVAIRLVEAGVSLTLLNDKNMMPLGLCEDPEMFRALFSRIDDRRIENEMEESRANVHPCKTILHYAALHCTDEALIEKLYLAAASTRPIYLPGHQSSKELLEHVDEEGNPFLHKAGKHMLKVIFKGLIRKERDFTKLVVMNCGLYDAIMGNRRLFDAQASQEATSDDQRNPIINLKSIEKELRYKLDVRYSDAKEKEKQVLQQPWNDSLPTYLALYLGKHEVLNFLLDSRLGFTLNQSDAVEKRTCLHWAVLHNRVDIVDRLFICSLSCCKGKMHKQEMVECRMRFKKPSPRVMDGAGMTAFHIAFNQKNEVMMQTLRRQKEFNEYEDKLLKDREVYVQSLNAILVGAALIASITFAGWLQVPSHVFGSSEMIIFWITNSLSFISAVAAMGWSIGILLLTPTIYIGQVVFELQRGIMYIACFLVFSLMGTIVAFTTAGFAASGDQAPQPEYKIVMGTVAGLGGLVCVAILTYYIRQVKLHSSAYRQQRITSHSNEEHEPPRETIDLGSILSMLFQT